MLFCYINVDKYFWLLIENIFIFATHKKFIIKMQGLYTIYGILAVSILLGFCWPTKKDIDKWLND